MYHPIPLEIRTFGAARSKNNLAIATKEGEWCHLNISMTVHKISPWGISSSFKLASPSLFVRLLSQDLKWTKMSGGLKETEIDINFWEYLTTQEEVLRKHIGSWTDSEKAQWEEIQLSETTLKLQDKATLVRDRKGHGLLQHITYCLSVMGSQFPAEIV